MMNGRSVVLFDGVCNLCNGFVRFIIKRDKEDNFLFASLQSSEAKQLLDDHAAGKSLTTIVLIENGKIYTRSTAALRICRRLSGGWPLLYGLIIIPTFIRNGVYNFVAKFRYRFFGKKDHCMVPTEDIRQKFFDYDNNK